MKGGLATRAKCDSHPDVDPVRMWGCPDCLYEVKRELSQAQVEIERLEELVAAKDDLLVARGSKATDRALRRIEKAKAAPARAGGS